MHIFAQKPKTTQKSTSTKSVLPSRAHFGQSHEVDTSLHLYKIIGHQAVNRLSEINTAKLQGESTNTEVAYFGHDFSRLPVHSYADLGIQPKLMVNKPIALYEQVGDHGAAQVIRKYESKRRQPCACGDGCLRCNGQAVHQHLQTTRVHSDDTREMETPPIVHEVLGSSGQPLTAAAREFMEPRFGHDFSRVRVHSDAQAAKSALALNALAYSVGRHVVFGEGQYDVSSPAGKGLLAHELAHTVQQRSQPDSVLRASRVGETGNHFEQEADRVAEAALADNLPLPARSKRVGGPASDAEGVRAQAIRDIWPTPAITPLPVAMIQRKASFVRSVPDEKYNAAEQILKDPKDRVWGQTRLFLNGVNLEPGTPVPNNAIVKPIIEFHPRGGKVECQVTNVGDNVGSVTETVLSKGPWSTTTTHKKIRTEFGPHTRHWYNPKWARVTGPCFSSGPTTLTVEGNPSDAAIAKSNREHEDKHARFAETAFTATVKPWDQALNSGKKFTGPDGPACEASLYAKMGGTPECIAENYNEAWGVANSEFHRKAAKKKVSDPECNPKCEKFSVKLSEPK